MKNISEEKPASSWFKNFAYDLQQSFRGPDLYRDTPIRYLGILKRKLLFVYKEK